MAQINITATNIFNHGPEMPSDLYAHISNHPWPGGGTLPRLDLHLGSDVVSIFPADPDKIRGLIESLQKCVEKLKPTSICGICNGTGSYEPGTTCIECEGTGK